MHFGLIGRHTVVYWWGAERHYVFSLNMSNNIMPYFNRWIQFWVPNKTCLYLILQADESFLVENKRPFCTLTRCMPRTSMLLDWLDILGAHEFPPGNLDEDDPEEDA